VGHGFAEQLRFFGLEVADLEYLIRQECFTEEEKRLYAHPCANSTLAHRTKTAEWVAKSGGLDGKPLGIHANHVQPFERVLELLVKLLGL
jgi:hypothetical protein